MAGPAGRRLEAHDDPTNRERPHTHRHTDFFHRRLAIRQLGNPVGVAVIIVVVSSARPPCCLPACLPVVGLMRPPLSLCTLSVSASLPPSLPLVRASPRAPLCLPSCLLPCFRKEEKQDSCYCNPSRALRKSDTEPEREC